MIANHCLCAVGVFMNRLRVMTIINIILTHTCAATLIIILYWCTYAANVQRMYNHKKDTKSRAKWAFILTYPNETKVHPLKGLYPNETSCGVVGWKNKIVCCCQEPVVPIHPKYSTQYAIA